MTYLRALLVLAVLAILAQAQTAPKISQLGVMQSPATPMVVLLMPGSLTPFVAQIDATTLQVTGTAPNYVLKAIVPPAQTAPPLRISNETPTRTSARVFTLAKPPTAAADVCVWLNGIRQSSLAAPTADYTVSGSTITFYRDIATGEAVLADYSVPAS